MRFKSFGFMVSGCLLASTLSSCGGGSSWGEGIGHAITCGFLNCTNSGTMSLGDINAAYVVSQNGNDVNVTASFGQTSNLITQVTLTDGDSVSASVDGQSGTLASVGVNFPEYAIDFTDGNSQPSVTVNFNRNGTSYPSTVTLPKQFALLAPLPPASVTRGMGSFTVGVGIADESMLSTNMNVQCTRLDGTSFKGTSDLPYGPGSTVSGGMSFKVDLNTLDTTLNSIGQSANTASPDTSQVTSCDLQVTWTMTQVGTASSSLYKHSLILGETSVGQSLHYDAQR